MVEKCIRGGIYHSIYRYPKTNKKYMKDYDKNKESSYLQYWDVNNLNNFEWIEDNSLFNEDFIKTIMKKVIKDIFLKLMFNILKIYIIFTMIYHFCLKE